MPATELKSCRTPGSDPDLLAEVFAWPLAATGLPLASSQVAVFLLKNSDDDSRRLGTRFVRAMVFVAFDAAIGYVFCIGTIWMGRNKGIQFKLVNTSCKN